MSKNLVKLWVEWDVGQDEVVFKTAASAIRWLEKQLKEFGIEYSVSQLEEEGLFGFEPVRLVEELDASDS